MYVVNAVTYSIPLYAGRTNLRYYCAVTNFVSQKLYDFVYLPGLVMTLVAVLFMYGRIVHFLRNRDSTISDHRQQVSDPARKVTKLALFVIGKDNMILSWPYFTNPFTTEQQNSVCRKFEGIWRN